MQNLSRGVAVAILCHTHFKVYSSEDGRLAAFSGL
jgi:hypothetical protein